MIPSTERFSNRVENYVRYRPQYPKELFEYLYNHAGFASASIIADIGSGTGILTRPLLERGSAVIGVEPNGKMREAAQRLLGRYPGFTSVDGTAEATGIPDRSVDHIVCAQAFHWFDRDACRVEFSRILKERGQVVLVWNNRLADAPGFGAGYEKLLQLYANDYNQVNHRLLTDGDLARFFAGGVYDKVVLANDQSLSLEGLRGRLLSCSYAPVPGEPNHDVLMEKLTNIFARYSTGGMILLQYETVCYAGKVN